MFITQNINAAKSAEIGNVITHVIIIRCAVFHLTPLALLEDLHQELMMIQRV